MQTKTLETNEQQAGVVSTGSIDDNRPAEIPVSTTICISPLSDASISGSGTTAAAAVVVDSPVVYYPNLHFIVNGEEVLFRSLARYDLSELKTAQVIRDTFTPLTSSSHWFAFD